MADEGAEELEFASHEEQPEPDAPEAAVYEPPRSRPMAALVLAIVGVALVAWFFVLIVGHSEDWRGQGEKWAGLETGSWMWVLAALFLVVLVAEAVMLFKRISSRSGEYVGTDQAHRPEDEPVVVGEAERGYR